MKSITSESQFRSFASEEGPEFEESGGGDIGLVKPTLFGGNDRSGGIVLAAYNTATLHLIRPKVPDIVASCSGLRGVIDLSTTSGVYKNWVLGKVT